MKTEMTDTFRAQASAASRAAPQFPGAGLGESRQILEQTKGNWASTRPVRGTIRPLQRC